jgi:hypothetical protein
MTTRTIYDSDRAGFHTVENSLTCYHNHCSEVQFLLKFQSMSMEDLVTLRASVKACQRAFYGESQCPFTGMRLKAEVLNESAQAAFAEDETLLSRIEIAIDGKLAQPQTCCIIS